MQFFADNHDSRDKAGSVMTAPAMPLPACRLTAGTLLVLPLLVLIVLIIGPSMGAGAA